MLATALILFLVPQTHPDQGEWTTIGLDELLRAAGVRRVEVASTTTEPTSRLRIPGLADVAWRSVDPVIQFEELPFAASRLTPIASLDRADPSTTPPTIDWAARVPGLAFRGPEPELLLTIEPSGVLARGTLTLVPSPQAGLEPQEERLLLGVRVGCALTCTSEFPIRLADDPIEVEFEWDLHSPIDISGTRLAFDTNFGDVPTFVIRLDERGSLLDTPRVLEVGEDELAAFEMRARSGSKAFVTDLDLPPCVRLEHRDELPGGEGERFAFVATDLGRTFHDCGSIRLQAFVDGGDSMPFSRTLDIVHTGPVRDSEARRILFAAVMEGEPVELWSRGDGVRAVSHLVFTARVPCATSALGALGFRHIASSSIPSPAQTVDLVIGEGAVSLRLRGTVSRTIMESFDDWSLACEN